MGPRRRGGAALAERSDRPAGVAGVALLPLRRRAGEAGIEYGHVALAIDRYSKDYEELQTKDKVKFYKTPDSVLQKQLDIYDQVVEKKSA